METYSREALLRRISALESARRCPVCGQGRVGLTAISVREDRQKWVCNACAHCWYEGWLLSPLGPVVLYDPDYGNDRLCVCGHPYYRHFDTYEEMAPAGCKYCRCERFKPAVEENRV